MLQLHRHDQPTGRTNTPIVFETGLLRSLLLGAVLGFVLVFIVVAGGLALLGSDAVVALMGGAFVGGFAGVGFGAMTGASIHQPPSGGPGVRD